MNIKLAEDIVKDMDARGPINAPDNCITGEDFEQYLRKKEVKEYFHNKVNNISPFKKLKEKIHWCHYPYDKQ